MFVDVVPAWVLATSMPNVVWLANVFVPDMAMFNKVCVFDAAVVALDDNFNALFEDNVFHCHSCAKSKLLIVFTAVAASSELIGIESPVGLFHDVTPAPFVVNT